ncbi:hypothetical protein CK203_079475 [Vitis vinifera]|uniref:Reverse transcriptase RNase H-like domain-containing protein n=1 Tax=Vitis vinifera TaxID=29760 RepID=A0A438CNV4_VITVI|nr:hypothetical protein CK203_079475 [Vitis vinifera]
MDTRGKTNAEFRNEVNEALARHESSFDKVNATLQAVLRELQALRIHGEDPINWIYRAEQYFEFQNIVAETQVQLASFILKALHSSGTAGISLALSTYEKEMLVVVKAIKKWRPYLLGKPFTVRTDHRSLKYLLEQRITTPVQTRWLPKILGMVANTSEEGPPGPFYTNLENRRASHNLV